ncbi:M23 family metallopeptidase [Laceyella sacchari]|jgi:stage II sporulation protein Q|uniref:M23 family metallopeptidase n=1 Tax=Laceyella sacchari TaxID=37482 RepID=A0ABY5U4M9_LACSH|nr:M23 family metallopeptidase [Laceyella sacchari]TCW39236.1 stage II sporulation protein Q [Laceyella sacchari]UWE03540.1 M23 family metallopeptidase [Laceyella sacchari]
MRPEEPNKTVTSLEQAQKRLKWKKLFAKKWFFPAIYLVTAALILTIAWLYQEHGSRVTETNKPIPASLPKEKMPTNPTDDDMVLPTAKNSGAVKTMDFYDEAKSNKDREAALVDYANAFWPHAGIDFARKDGKSFEVVAALEGKVIRVEEHPVLGHQIEIKHESGISTVYQSLDDIRVKQGQIVKKGQVIGKAGRNLFEKEAGVHLHFEVRGRDQQAVNPAQYLPQTKQ